MLALRELRVRGKGSCFLEILFYQSACNQNRFLLLFLKPVAFKLEFVDRGTRLGIRRRFLNKLFLAGFNICIRACIYTRRWSYPARGSCVMIKIIRSSRIIFSSLPSIEWLPLDIFVGAVLEIIPPRIARRGKSRSSRDKHIVIDIVTIHGRNLRKFLTIVCLWFTARSFKLGTRLNNKFSFYFLVV